MPVLHILAQMHITPDQALVVGDMPVDILMGRNAGTRTCGVTYGNGTPADLISAGAHHLIDDFADLLTLI